MIVRHCGLERPGRLFVVAPLQLSERRIVLSCAGRTDTSRLGAARKGPRLFGHLASFTSSWPLKDRIGSRFRLPSMDRRHPSSLWAWAHAFFRAFVSAAKALSGAYEEGIAGMLTIIKASLLGSALMLLESCTGYLTSYQTPCVEGHVCECVQYTTVYRSWLDCRDYGRVKSRAY